MFLAQSGAEMEPTRPGDINITSTGIILDRPQPDTSAEPDTPDEDEIPESPRQGGPTGTTGSEESGGKVLIEPDPL